MRCRIIGLVLSFYIGGVTCLISRSMSGVEGESPTIDCGFQTSVDGGNLMWRAISTDSETLLGHIVPGDHFCGTDTLMCTLHTNGSITLVNVAMDDGDKRYRCLRGDEDGYHYFSDVNLTVLAKGVTPPIVHSVQSVVEGESLTIDCGFQTSVDGGNLMWRALSTDSETLLGHIVPGDHFCGTDTLMCTVHTDGSITLVNVTMDDGDKRYRCLRGDTEGYHYFSDFNLTVLAKGTIGHTLINEVTESCTIREKSVIYCYDQPTCKDDKDRAVIVTCDPPFGEMIDKVYDQVHCNYTDTDGNPNSLSITVKSHGKLKENHIVAIITTCINMILISFLCVTLCVYQRYKHKNAVSPEHVVGCCLTSSVKGITGRSSRSLSQHDEEEQQLNLVTVTHSETLDDDAESRDNSEEFAKLMKEKMDEDISDLRQRLSEKETECTDESEELNKLEEILQQKLISKMEEEYFHHTGCKNTDALKLRCYFHEDLLIGIQCEFCLSEWVVEKCLPPNNLEDELMSSRGRQLHVLKKPYVDKGTFRVELKETEIRDISNLAAYLSPGDHIKYTSCPDFFDHAIVKEVTRDNISLIHWHHEDGRRGAIKGKVIEENIGITEMRTMTNVIFRMDYRGGAVQEGTVQEDSIILTLARAKAWLGEKSYPPLTNNCEHFAVYCKVGNHWSFQKEQLIKRFVTLLQKSCKQIGFKLENNNASTIMEIATLNFSEISLLAPQMQVIGLGLVVVIHGVAILLDLKEIYRKRNDGDIGEEEFVGRFYHSIYRRLGKVFHTGVIPTGCVVTFGALLPASAPATGTSILVGAICAGVLSIPWGSNGKIKLGRHKLNRLVVNIQPREKAIDNIQDLSPGDHIIMYRWFLHPRCHMIVTSVDLSSGSMCVIRFTYPYGVKEEKVNFHTPLCKVIHKRPYPPDIIIKRARKSQIPSGAYNILSFNCKHFAFWCQTNTLPNC